MRFFPALLTFGVAGGMILGGCTSYTGDFINKTAEELAAMERVNAVAHNCVLDGEYDAAEEHLYSLVAERTVNRPLYALELISTLLLNHKYDEALRNMQELHVELDSLSMWQDEGDKQNLWHGKAKNVYKGNGRERSIFYSLMALEFIRHGNYDDAMRCVQIGLSTDRDFADETNDAKAMNADPEMFQKNFALLFYVGYLASAGQGDEQNAEYFFMLLQEELDKLNALSGEEDKTGKLEFQSATLNNPYPNVLLVVWAGTPPVQCYDDKSGKFVWIYGKRPMDSLSVTTDAGAVQFFPSGIGNLETYIYQENQTDGENALKMHLITLAVGNPDDILSQLFLDGRKTWLETNGLLLNPKKNVLYWRNLPGEFFLLPLSLSAGDHRLLITGYDQADRVAMMTFDLTVDGAPGINVVHLPMFLQGESAGKVRLDFLQRERQRLNVNLIQDRMAKEIQ